MDGSPQPHFTEEDRVKGVHIVFCHETGNPISLTLHRMMIWQAWLRHGWTADDIKTTVRYIRKRYFNPDRPQIVKGMLHFSRLIEQPETFEEYLMDAKADQRNARPAPTQRTQALKAVGREEKPAANGHAVKTAESVVRDLTADYDALRKAAGL